MNNKKHFQAEISMTKSSTTHSTFDSKWGQRGMKLQNTFFDFIAAAEALIEQHYTA